MRRSHQFGPSSFDPGEPKSSGIPWKRVIAGGMLLIAGPVGFGLAQVMLRDPASASVMSENFIAAVAEPLSAPIEAADQRIDTAQPVIRAEPPAAPTAPASAKPEIAAATAPRPVVEGPVPKVEDPRWAREMAAPATPIDELAGRMQKADDGLEAGENSAAIDEPLDPRQTAAIPALSRPETRSADGKPPSRAARVNAAVTMRALPANGSAVVKTIRSGATVQVVDCSRWCEIVHEGRRGFVASRFLGGAAAVRESRAPAPAVKAKTTTKVTAKALPAVEGRASITVPRKAVLPADASGR